jgi:hypothetical protein
LIMAVLTPIDQRCAAHRWAGLALSYNQSVQTVTLTGVEYDS